MAAAAAGRGERGGAVGDCRTRQGRFAVRLAARLAARGGQEVRVPARVGNSRLLKPSRQASSVKCGARSSRKRRAAAGSGAAQRSRGSLDATRARGRAPPTTGSRVGRLGLGRPQPLVRHHTRSQLLAVYGAGVSRGGLEGARYERTTPQTVWEPGRPFQWFGLRAPLVRSTKWAFSWRPLGQCYLPARGRRAPLTGPPRRAPPHAGCRGACTCGHGRLRPAHGRLPTRGGGVCGGGIRTGTL